MLFFLLCSWSRDPLSLSTVSSIRHKQTNGVPRSRLTSTPKYSSPLVKPVGRSRLLEGPRRPPADPMQINTPSHLYESFLSESSSALRHGVKSPIGRIETTDQIEKKTPNTRRRGNANSGSGKMKGLTLHKSPKPRPQTTIPSFTGSPSSQGIRPHSVQLETSSLLPPPVSSKENMRGQGSRYGYCRPLDLAHEESYYQLNRESPQATREGQFERSFAGQLLAGGNDRRQTQRSHVTARPKSILLTPGTKINKVHPKIGNYIGNYHSAMVLNWLDCTVGCGSGSGIQTSVVVETFPRPLRDLSTCLTFEIVRYIKIPTTEAIESNDLNIENW